MHRTIFDEKGIPPHNYEITMTNIRRSAFSLIEMMIAIAIVAVVGAVAFSNLFGGNQSTDVSTTGQQIVALAREAQSQSAAGHFTRPTACGLNPCGQSPNCHGQVGPSASEAVLIVVHLIA
jgi:prepilin-type N-terminal cleavage/methylation domain-containing protein